MPRLLPPKFLIPSRRLFTSHTTRRAAFGNTPAPPRLPPKEQEEFERLQRSSTGAFSTPNASPSTDLSSTATSSIITSHPRPQVNQSPESSQAAQDASVEAPLDASVTATGTGEELHPDIRRGARPEFEGDRNPKTGEIGGPKNDPLRWGSSGERGDWSYNGRVTDFDPMGAAGDRFDT